MTGLQFPITAYSYRFYDEEHSIDEDRYITIGMSNKNRMLLVAHTDFDNCYEIMALQEFVLKPPLVTTKNA